MILKNTSLPVWLAVSSLAIGGAAFAEPNDASAGTRQEDQTVNPDDPKSAAIENGAEQRRDADAAGDDVAADPKDRKSHAAHDPRNTMGSEPAVATDARETAAIEQFRMIGKAGNTHAADQLFVLDAAMGNVWETRFSELVARRSTDDQVKALARQIATDHQQANEQLRHAAKELNLTISDDLPASKEAKLQVYENMPVADLERCYLIEQKAIHAKAVTSFADHAQSVKNVPLKKFVSDTLPKLRQHTDHLVTVAESKGIKGDLMLGAGTDSSGRQPEAGADTEDAINR